jgi:ABC-type transport system involved in multi-copper enzyme maturation permease subunit
MAVPDISPAFSIAPDRPRGSRWDYALLAAAAAVAVAAAIVEASAVVVTVLTLPSLVALQWLVRRRGGWRFVGPHSYYDLIRMSRKGRTIVLRVLFLVVLLGGIWWAYERSQPSGFRLGAAMWVGLDRDVVAPDEGGEVVRGRGMLRGQLARLNLECTFVWFLLQNIAILVLTPAYVGGAIAEERESGTLDMLLATGLTNREIVLGKLAARLVHLGAFLIAGLPVFSIMLVWGGVDLNLLLASWAHTALMLVAVACICLMFSTMPARPSTCILTSYAVVLPSGWCCLATWHAGLQEAFLSTAGVSPRTESLDVLGAAYVVTIIFCLLIAITAVRQPEVPDGYVAALAQQRLARLEAPGTAVSLAAVATLTADERWGRRLRPITDNALRWKERYTGGRSLLLIPEFVAIVGPFAFLMACVIMGSAVSHHHWPDHPSGPHLAKAWGEFLQALYAAFLVCFVCGTALRAAATVVRERQAHTLDMLLLIPVERRVILHAKFAGAMWKGWPWLVLLGADLTFGLIIGAFHPLSFLFMAVFPVPLLLALCSVGMLISVIARTAGQANLAIAVTLLALGVYLGNTRPGLFLGVSVFTFSWWDKAAIGAMDVLAAVLSATALLAIAACSWGLAQFLFESSGRR